MTSKPEKYGFHLSQAVAGCRKIPALATSLGAGATGATIVTMFLKKKYTNNNSKSIELLKSLSRLSRSERNNQKGRTK